MLLFDTVWFCEASHGPWICLSLLARRFLPVLRTSGFYLALRMCVNANVALVCTCFVLRATRVLVANTLWGAVPSPVRDSLRWDAPYRRESLAMVPRVIRFHGRRRNDFKSRLESYRLKKKKDRKCLLMTRFSKFIRNRIGFRFGCGSLCRADSRRILTHISYLFIIRLILHHNTF